MNVDVPAPSVHSPSLGAAIRVAVLMLIACGVSMVMTPTLKEVAQDNVNLERMVPSSFGAWHEIKTGVVPMDLAPRDGEERTMDQPYDQVLMRSYGRSDGAIVMLALAYGRNQRQEVKIHRPELCYVAQGFEVVDRKVGTLQLSDVRQVEAYRLVARGRDRVEPVTYWIRIGDRIVRNAWESRVKIFRDGLNGTVPDGLLVRASSLARSTGDVPAAHEVQEEFLRDLYRALDEGSRVKLTGG